MNLNEVINATKRCTNVTVNKLGSYVYDDDGKLSSILEDVKLRSVEGTECTDVEYDEKGRISTIKKTTYEGRGFRKKPIAEETSIYTYGLEIENFTETTMKKYLKMKDKEEIMVRHEFSHATGKTYVVVYTDFDPEEGTVKTITTDTFLLHGDVPVSKRIEK